MLNSYQLIDRPCSSILCCRLQTHIWRFCYHLHHQEYWFAPKCQFLLLGSSVCLTMASCSWHQQLDISSKRPWAICSLTRFWLSRFSWLSTQACQWQRSRFDFEYTCWIKQPSCQVVFVCQGQLYQACS